MLRKIKKKIEDEFTEAVNDHVKEVTHKVKSSKPKKVIAKKDKKSTPKTVAKKTKK